MQFEGPKCTPDGLKEKDDQQLDTGSRSEKGEKDEVSKVGGGGPADGILGGVDEGVETGPVCHFYRGKCKHHKIKGDKIVKKVKKKHGYGWLTLNILVQPDKYHSVTNLTASMMDSRSPGRISVYHYDESFTLGQSVDNYHVGGRLSGDVEIKEN